MSEIIKFHKKLKKVIIDRYRRNEYGYINIRHLIDKHNLDKETTEISCWCYASNGGSYIRAVLQDKDYNTILVNYNTGFKNRKSATFFNSIKEKAKRISFIGFNYGDRYEEENWLDEGCDYIVKVETSDNTYYFDYNTEKSKIIDENVLSETHDNWHFLFKKEEVTLTKGSFSTTVKLNQKPRPNSLRVSECFYENKLFMVLWNRGIFREDVTYQNLYSDYIVIFDNEKKEIKTTKMQYNIKDIAGMWGHNNYLKGEFYFNNNKYEVAGCKHIIVDKKG